MLRENYFLEFFSHAHSDLFFQYAHTCMKNAHAHTHGCGLNANSSSVKLNPRILLSTQKTCPTVCYSYQLLYTIDWELFYF